jgi:hypothetical protein
MDNPGAAYDKRLLNLKSSTFLNTYQRISVTEIAETLKDKQGSDVTTDPSRWNLDNSDYGKIHAIWKEANFNSSAMKWTNYYPGKEFSQEFVDDVAFYLRLKGVHRAWISRVDPGYYAPWHWDVDDNEQEYLKYGEIKRYSIMMGDKTPGHIFMLGEDYLYNCVRGSIFRWNNHNEWHSGINAGMTPKFMFHIIGY